MENSKTAQKTGREDVKTKITTVDLVSGTHLYFPHTPGDVTACGDSVDLENDEPEVLDCTTKPSNLLGACTDCLKQWSAISEFIYPEETVECVRCTEVTTVFDGRGVNHETVEQEVPVCKDCYISLYEDGSTDVVIEYPEASTYESDRVFLTNYQNHQRKTISEF